MDRLTGLQLFVRAAEAGSFSRAARDLNLTQPTVTKHIAALERELGARLLNRNTRGLSLTEVGSLYFDKCKRILAEYEEAQGLVSLQKSQVAGTLRISTPVALGRRVVTPLIFEFMRRHPQLRVDLACDDVYVDLVAQGMDVAVRMGSLADSTLGARYLGVNPWMMVGAPDYLRRHGVPRLPHELARHNVLIYSRVQGDAHLRFQQPDGHSQSVAVSGALRSNNLSTVLEAVRSGMGLAALPCYVAAGAVASGELVAIMRDHVLPSQEVHAVYPSARQVPVKVSALIAFLKEHFSGEWWLEGERSRADDETAGGR